MAEFKYDDFKGYEKKSYARLEFLALAEDIAPLLNKGLSAKAIYRYFQDKGRLTMCYQTFAYYMRSKAGTTKPKPVETVQQVPEKPPVALDSASALPEQPETSNSQPEQETQPLGKQKNSVEHEHNAAKNKTKLI